jgi:hypothetical protein
MPLTLQFSERSRWLPENAAGMEEKSHRETNRRRSAVQLPRWRFRSVAVNPESAEFTLIRVRPGYLLAAR